MARTIEKMIEEQVKRWQIERTKKKKEIHVPVITISREPGSGGRILAEKIASRLGFDLFDQELIQTMAGSDTNQQILKTLDEKGLNVLEHWISSVVDRRHLWPDEHLGKLMEVVGTIGKHGRAIIVGRGANFILPPEERFRLRLIAPLKTRVKNVCRDYGVSADEAKRRILKTESDRKAFVRKMFYADIADPLNYDLVINTATIQIDDAVNLVACAFGKC